MQLSFTMQYILDEIKRRQIRYLVHFTRVRNLESILTNGLVPRNMLQNKDIPCECNDCVRADGREDCTCFSIEYPNEFLFNTFKARHKDDAWCVLQLDIINVLKNHNGTKHYCMYNAAGSSEWVKNPKSSSLLAFRNMFLESNPDSRHPYTRTSKGLKDFLPTHHQAEILIENTIYPKYITAVFFSDQVDFKNFGQNLKNKNLLKQFNFQCDDFYFKGRDNVAWRDR